MTTDSTTIYDWYPTRFICAHDLRGRHVIVQIVRWAMEIINRNGEEVEVPVLYFEGKQKGMRLAKTNARIVGKLHGPSPDNWIGKWISIYPASGQLGDEVRVEQKVPEPPAKKPGRNAKDADASVKDADGSTEKLEAPAETLPA